MHTSFNRGVDELLKVLELGRQNWLLGAGVSYLSGIPLMDGLTTRVTSLLNGRSLQIFKEMLADLPMNGHVEHVLSHLGDLIALAARARNKNAVIQDNSYSLQDLNDTYRDVVQHIAHTVRFGFRAAAGAQPEEAGDIATPIITVDAHQAFVQQVFRRRSNLEPRSQISFLTTNYDTLLEDALGLERRIPLDGFEGGALAFWTGASIEPTVQTSTQQHRVLKLHGSVDWFNDARGGLRRIRYGTKYLADLGNTLIYPQATKYLETQKDPFATIFTCFRKTLHATDHHLLAIVGYSFGDDHINAEIEQALAAKNNKTVVVAFSKEMLLGNSVQLQPTLARWLNNEDFGQRIYVASDQALYNANQRLAPPPGISLSWWTFEGVTNLLRTGRAV